MPQAPARRLLTRLLLGTLIPTLLALGAFGFLAHEVARRVLEDELGRRLALAAAGTAGMILPEQMVALAEDAEDGASLTLENVRRRLATARERFAVRRIVLVSVKADQADLIARVDTDARIAPGANAHELGADRLELARAAAGHPTASPLFIGHDQLAYERGYAAIRDDAAVLGFAVVEASADYLVPLATFRHQLLVAGSAALALVLGVTILMARRVSQPVVRLAAAAERIGRGNLDSPVPVETNDEVGFLASTIDQMRTALKARDERMQMMLAGIAHEVRNPLGGLELYAGLLREALQDRPERLEEVRRIEREVHYLKVVVAEFLDYARRPEPELAAVNLAELLDEVRELVSASPVKVEVACEANVRVRADAGQLRRAVLNLARNAVAAAERRHGDGKGLVRLRAHRDGGRLQVEVEDNGAGIAPELREKIFTPFFTTREKGTGLGLAFVREIVEDHGSDIRVTEVIGGGARFFFTLAIVEQTS
ncbi:MAG TPA: HAMP domain-containing sensor histidine kinase [Polyangia bacterium]|jgi:signal transduction histidine kinase